MNSPYVTSSAAGAYGAKGRIGQRDYTQSTLWQNYQRQMGSPAGVTATAQPADFNQWWGSILPWNWHVGGAPSASENLQTVGKGAYFLTQSGFWIRVGLFGVGGLIVLFCLARLAAGTQVGQTIIETGKKAAKTAAKAAEAGAVAA